MYGVSTSPYIKSRILKIYGFMNIRVRTFPYIQHSVHFPYALGVRVSVLSRIFDHFPQCIISACFGCDELWIPRNSFYYWAVLIIFKTVICSTFWRPILEEVIYDVINTKLIFLKSYCLNLLLISKNISLHISSTDDTLLYLDW